MGNLGNRLSEARKRRNLTQKRLAEISGVPQQTISKIERDDQKSTTQLVELAEALGVTAKWLATGIESGEPSPIAATEPAGSTLDTMVVADNSMAPEFQKGHIIQYDISRSPEPDDIVVAEIKRGTLTIRRYWLVTESGKTCSVLVAANPAYPRVNASDCRIIGVAVSQTIQIG